MYIREAIHSLIIFFKVFMATTKGIVYD